MLVVTNRRLNPGKNDEDAFGEQPNEKGPNELRLAHATKTGAKWRVEVVPEPKELTPENAPSKKEYAKLLARARKEHKHVLFFIHGFNKPFPETLEQGWRLQERYGIEVVLFSWPSNPGGLPLSEYRQSRRVAQASFGALDSALEKLARYLRFEDYVEDFDKRELLACQVTINLMAYSLGGYLLQNYVLSNEYAMETRVFANVVLCQCDVDHAEHELWVEKTVAGQRLYITINENDKVLSYSDTVNRPRLGKTLHTLNADNALYIDFTAAAGVGQKHQLWGEVNAKNVKAFFGAAFAGARAEETSGLAYDARVNAFRVA